jgi:hypothetical protein
MGVNGIRLYSTAASGNIDGRVKWLMIQWRSLWQGGFDFFA